MLVSICFFRETLLLSTNLLSASLVKTLFFPEILHANLSGTVYLREKNKDLYRITSVVPKSSYYYKQLIINANKESESEF